MPNIIPITDFSAPELDVYARLSEIQLYHYQEPDYGIFIAESPKVIERALDQGYVPVSMLVEEKDVDEIALTLGRPRKTVQTQLYRAKQSLQKMIREGA